MSWRHSARMRGLVLALCFGSACSESSATRLAGDEGVAAGVGGAAGSTTPSGTSGAVSTGGSAASAASGSGPLSSSGASGSGGSGGASTGDAGRATGAGGRGLGGAPATTAGGSGAGQAGAASASAAGASAFGAGGFGGAAAGTAGASTAGMAGAGAAGAAGAPSYPPATFTEIYEQVFQVYCLKCHNNKGRQPYFGTKQDTYDFFVQPNVIFPGENPNYSAIYVYTAWGIMPPDPNPKVPEAGTDLVAGWIYAGALNN